MHQLLDQSNKSTILPTAPEMTAGPKLLAGFVLVPEIAASKGTMMAYRNGNINGVNLRICLNPIKITRSETIVNVVITSPSNTVEREYPAPGTVTPNSILLPI